MTKDKRREYGEGSVFQRANGRWVGKIEAGYNHKGERVRIEVSGKTEHAVLVKMKQRQRQLKDHGYNPHAAVTVKVWSDRWLEKAETQLRPKPFAASRSAIRKWIVPTIGRRKLESLTRADLDRVMVAQRAAGLKSASIRRTHTVAIKLLKDAQAYGYVVPPGVLTMPAPPAGENDREPMSVEQAIEVLRQIAASSDPSRWLAILFQALRTAERLGMTWPGIDFDRRTITVSWQLQEIPYRVARDPKSGFRIPDGYEVRQLENRWCLVRPKTEASWRVIPMTRWMEAALLVWRDLAPASEHDLVWARPDGGPIDPDDAIAEWRALQDLAGVRHPYRTTTVDGATVPDWFIPHEGRHTVATLLKELGVDDASIVAIMGHSSMLSSRVYVHENQLAKARAALASLDERLQITG